MQSFARFWILKMAQPKLCCFCFSGMSNSGKTTFIKKLLEMAPRVFTEAPSRIIYFYNIYQEKFAQLEEGIENIGFFQGLPQRSDIEKYSSSERHLVLVSDDLYQDVISSRDICDLTIMLCHHLNVTIFSQAIIYSMPVAFQRQSQQIYITYCFLRFQTGFS